MRLHACWIIFFASALCPFAAVMTTRSEASYGLDDGGDSIDGQDRSRSLKTLQNAGNLTDALLVSISCEKHSFAQLEKIEIDVVASNRDTGKYIIPLVKNKYNLFRIYVYDSGGKLARTTEFGNDGLRAETMMGGTAIGSTFAPGKKREATLVANLGYDMTKPGKYTIVVEFSAYRFGGSPNGFPMVIGQSNPLVVFVEGTDG